MCTKQIKDEEMLLEQLVADVEDCGKEKIVFIAGHFPLIYTQEGIEEALDEWDAFSPYTLELACQVGKHAKGIGKQVEFVFFVDDHMDEEGSQLSRRQRSQRRKRIYRKRSGPDAQLPERYRGIMQQYGFAEDDVLRQDQGKSGRGNCLYFSEKILRGSRREIGNVCAREYVEFIEDPRYFDKGHSHMIAFIPQRCRGHICNVALDQEIEGLSASHVFMETMDPGLKNEELYSEELHEIGRGVLYRRD